jgi:2-polyprenyl-3-methyl-5-hydroxy-6-metoxy-1,4-benzoquinol methylase
MEVWDFGSSRVLEIGCGLGLASMVIHRRQGDVTASDYHPLTEAFLQANLLPNQLPAMKYLTGNWSRANPELGTFDLIIGSDVLYERSQPEQLAAFIQLHATPRAVVLIIDPNRSNRSAFNRCMSLLGFELSDSLIEGPLHDGSAYKGRLLRYRREREARQSTSHRSRHWLPPNPCGHGIAWNNQYWKRKPVRAAAATG